MSNAQEIIGLEASSSNQPAIHVGLPEQVPGVARFHTPPVEDLHLICNRLIVPLSQQPAKVSVDLNVPRDVLVLPRTAIQYTSYGDSVYAIRPQEEGNKEGDLEVIQRFVTLGEARGDYIEIIDGLEAGDEVASSGLLKLRSGQPVMIENALKPQAKLAPTPPQG